MPAELAAGEFEALLGRRSGSGVFFWWMFYFGVPLLTGLLAPIRVALRSGAQAGKQVAANLGAWTGLLLLLIGPALALILLFAKYETRGLFGGSLILLGVPVLGVFVASLLGYGGIALVARHRNAD